MISIGTITSIGSAVFYYCSKLSNVVLTDGLPYIGEYMFYQDSAIVKIEIPSTVTAIGM